MVIDLLAKNPTIESPKFMRLGLAGLMFAFSLGCLHAMPAQADWEHGLERSALQQTKTIALEHGLPSYQWTPRPAFEYLDSSSEARLPLIDPILPVQFHAVQAPIAPILPSPPKIIPPSLTARSFDNGVAGPLSYDQLVDARVFVSEPLHGSIFKRKSSVKYIILHSTETASPADAQRVILSWNNRGPKHPGSQFLVDRDGTIYSTVNPDDVTIHIDTNRCLTGYSNDNSVGIEIVRSGKQQYTQLQLTALTKLVSYLQAHYGVDDSSVTTHQHVQPSDRSDPVNFDFLAFENSKSGLRSIASRFDGSARVQSRAIGSAMPLPAPDFRRSDF